MRKQSFIIISGLLLLVGCGEADVLPTAVPVTHLPTTAPTAHLPTATTLPPTSTPTEELPTPVSMPPPLFTSTPTQTPAVTPEPTGTAVAASSLHPPEGYITFLWSPVPPPDGSDASLTTDVYIISLDDWPLESQASPIIEGLFGWPSMVVSPDLTKIALLFANNEELAFNEMNRIGVYTLKNSLLQNMVNDTCCLYGINWLPDNHSIIYPQTNSLFVAAQGKSPQELTNEHPLPTNSELFNPVISPDGKILAITRSTPDTLSFFDMQNHNFVSISSIEYPSVFLTMDWSHDGRWLAFTNSFNKGLSVTNIKTFDVIQLENDMDTICIPAWSPNEMQLAFTCNNTLFMWNTDAQTSDEVGSATFVGEPVWSPDGKYLTASYVNEGQGGFWFIDPTSYEKQIISLDETVVPTVSSPPIWSPDGNWLLFLSEQENQTAYYIINKLDGIPYLILDVENNLLPYDFIWLPSNM